MKPSKKDAYIYSKSRIELFIGKYIVLLGIFAIILIFIIGIIYDGGFSLQSARLKVLSFVSLFLFFLFISARLILRRRIGTLEIDYDERALEFSMYVENTKTKYNFDDLEKIYVNGFINLLFRDDKFQINDLTNRNLFIGLNRIRKIDWGPDCWIWGPPKSFRNELDLMNNS
jgi:hypothetical protein